MLSIFLQIPTVSLPLVVVPIVDRLQILGVFTEVAAAQIVVYGIVRPLQRLVLQFWQVEASSVTGVVVLTGSTHWWQNCC